MRKLTASLVLAIAMLAGAAGAQELSPDDRALRSRITRTTTSFPCPTR